MEIMAKVTHYMCALKYSFQELILVAKIADVALLGSAHIFVRVISNELILKTMNSPTNVSRQGSKEMSIC